MKRWRKLKNRQNQLIKTDINLRPEYEGERNIFLNFKLDPPSNWRFPTSRGNNRQLLEKRLQYNKCIVVESSLILMLDIVLIFVCLLSPLKHQPQHFSNPMNHNAKYCPPSPGLCPSRICLCVFFAYQCYDLTSYLVKAVLAEASMFMNILQKQFSVLWAPSHKNITLHS